MAQIETFSKKEKTAIDISSVPFVTKIFLDDQHYFRKSNKTNKMIAHIAGKSLFMSHIHSGSLTVSVKSISSLMKQNTLLKKDELHPEQFNLFYFHVMPTFLSSYKCGGSRSINRMLE